MERVKVQVCAAEKRLNIWFCERCGAVHFRVGDETHSFSPQEFIDFSAAVAQLYCRALLALIDDKTAPQRIELDLVG